MDRIVMLLDLDSFFASAEENKSAKIKGKPVVICVYSGRSPDSGAVSTANYAARELGIRSGMPIIAAKKKAAESGREVFFLPADINHYRAISDRIMNALEEKADIMEQVSIDEAYMDVTEKCNGNWAAAENMAKEIKNCIKESENLTCSIGIGPNKLVAKVAASYKKPDGLTVVRQEEARAFLSPLHVTKLHGVGAKTAELLAKMGIKTAGELAAANILELEKVFGKNKALLLFNKANGIDNSAVKEREAKQISRIGTLPVDTDNFDEIFSKITQLTAELDARVKKKGVRFRTVSIITVDTTLGTQTRSRTIDETESSEEVLKNARELLKEFLAEEDKKLRRVGVRVSNLAYRKEQKTLGDFAERYFTR